MWNSACIIQEGRLSRRPSGRAYACYYPCPDFPPVTVPRLLSTAPKALFLN